MQLIGNVEGMHVVLVDDMVDTAGTICSAADMVMEKGAASVRAICTHPVLSGKAYERIEKSALVEIAVTDTIPLKTPSPKIRVLSVAELFAQAIHKIHENESISALFIENL
jgi:ribose-phosphate pyrophosphokinase